MTPRSLFSIILKALGIFFISDIVNTVPSVISSVSYVVKSPGSDELVWQLVYLIMQLAIFIYVSYFLIFNTQRLIDLFRLDSGFEEEQFSFNLSANSVNVIAIIVTGAYLVVTQVPELCRLIFAFLEDKGHGYGEFQTGISPTIVSVVRLLVGLLLIGERHRIASLFQKKQAENEEDSK